MYLSSVPSKLDLSWDKHDVKVKSLSQQ
jgi:hypothetical protein